MTATVYRVTKSLVLVKDELNTPHALRKREHDLLYDVEEGDVLRVETIDGSDRIRPLEVLSEQAETETT